MLSTRNGDVGREAPHITVFNQRAQRYKSIYVSRFCSVFQNPVPFIVLSSDGQDKPRAAIVQRQSVIEKYQR